MELIFTYSPIWIFLAFALAGIYTFILYRKDNLLVDVSKLIKSILATLRFVVVFTIAILLIGIILENLKNTNQKPLIFIAQDNSESIINNNDSLFYKNEFITNLQTLSDNLKSDYEVVEYSFSGGVENGIKNSFDGKLTNVSKVFNQIFDQYTNRNIGAIILSTDGIYNTDANPIYAVDRQSYIPVYTIGLGDTSLVKDFKIDKIYNNDIAFLGNKFPVEVVVSKNEFLNQKVKVSIYQNDKLVGEELVDFINNQQQYKLNFELDATKLGLVKYTVKIQELVGEFTYKNNESNFYVDVIDGRQKIALLYSGIHPDLGAISYVVENNKNYEVKLIEYEEFDNASKYDLLICHSYDGSNDNLNYIIKSGKKPCLFIVGTNTNLNLLSKQNVGFSGAGNKDEDVQVSFNGSFDAIQYPQNVYEMLSNAPPLKVPFGNFNFSAGIDVLAYQKIGNVTLDQPLMYFSQKNTSKYGVIMGEGIWRWRLYDQQKNNSTENFEAFITKTISYLALKENKKQFNVDVDNEYAESEDVKIDAELYNNTYDLINDPEVDFTLKDENDKEFEYHFFKTAQAYKLDLGRLAHGIYSWSASTVFDGKKYTDKGEFIVKEVNVEWLNVIANHRLLNNISQNTNGKFYLPNQLNELEKDIQTREDIVTTSYQEKSFDDLIDYKWIFFLIIGLISVEWFLRKYNGAY
jgi:hypothetical protein